MVPVLQLREDVVGYAAIDLTLREVAGGTPTTWHHAHFGLKSAPNRRDFRPEKEELN